MTHWITLWIDLESRLAAPRWSPGALRAARRVGWIALLVFALGLALIDPRV